MIIFTTTKKIKQIRRDSFSQGVTKGYELGHQMGQMEKSIRGFIIGAKVDREIEEIFQKEMNK